MLTIVRKPVAARRGAHPDFGDDAQRSLRAANQARQIEPRRLARTIFPADFNDLPIGQHHLHAVNMVGGNEILERMNSPGVGGGVSADGAGALAGRIGGKVKRRPARQLRDGIGKLRIPHPGFDIGRSVFQIDFENTVHLRGGDDDAVFKRDASAGQSGSRPARDDLHIMPR